MRRRKVLAALGAAAASGGTAEESGAFTSVGAYRNVSVAVASDTDALLRFAHCSHSPNGD